MITAIPISVLDDGFNRCPRDSSHDFDILPRRHQNRREQSDACARLQGMLSQVTNVGVPLIPISQLREQLDFLHQQYAGTRYTFRLDGIDRHADNTWARGGEEERAANSGMKRAFRKGTYSTLNVYFLSGILNSPFELYVICTFPTPSIWNRFQPVDLEILVRDGAKSI
jgi:hypothetical protein